MPSSKRKRPRRDDALAPYRKIRKPMPPPEQVIADRRRELQDDDARREIDEAAKRPVRPDRGARPAGDEP